MKKNILLLFLLLSLILYSCKNKNTTQDTSNKQKDKLTHGSVDSPTNIDKDTLLKVSIYGNAKEIHMKRLFVESFLNEIPHYDSISKRWKGRKLDTTSTTYIDITGDGKPEKLVSRATIDKEGDFYTARLIYQEEKLIYSDTCPVMIGMAAEGAEDGDSVFDVFRPYSEFEAAISVMDIIDKEWNGHMAATDSNVIIKKMGELEMMHLSKTKIKSEIFAFKKYLLNYKGKFIYRDYIEDKDIKLWYEPEHRFYDIIGD